MPAGIVLVDSGPLVALFDPSDAAHAACSEALDFLVDSHLVTTEAVVAEVEHILDFSILAQRSLLEQLATGRPRVEPLGRPDWLRASALMAKYSSLPMDYADATLVVLAERLNVDRVFTLDRRDFGIYRLGRKRFRLIPA